MVGADIAWVRVKAHLHRPAVTVYSAVGQIQRAVLGRLHPEQSARLNGKPLGLESRAIFPKSRSGTARTDQSLSLGSQASRQDQVLHSFPTTKSPGYLWV